LPAPVRIKITVLFEHHALLASEMLGAFAHQHDVLGMGHDPARQQDRVADVPRGCHGTGAEVSPVHDRSVQFVLTLRIEHGTAARVELRCVLEEYHGGGHRIQAAAPGGQHVVTRAHRARQHLADLRLLLRWHFSPFDGARATVYCDGNGRHPVSRAKRCNDHDQDSQQQAGQQRAVSSHGASCGVS
jgi:hypothetical protein